VQIQGPVVDRIPEASENILPSLPAEKSDLPLDVIQVELSSRAHVE